MIVRSAVKRRLAALLGVALLTITGLEPVMGSIRDGQLHHEATTTEADHFGFTRGDDGQHDGGGLPTPEHGNCDPHDTCADHCSHSHGPLAVAIRHFGCRDAVARESGIVIVASAASRFIEVGLQPPKA